MKFLYLRRRELILTVALATILIGGFTIRSENPLWADTIEIQPSPVDIRIMHVTNYSEIDSCHYENCPMASGRKAYVGAAACPRNWELGTKIEIGGTIYVCEDRYNSTLSDRIDLFTGYGVEAYEQAKSFGIQIKRIRVL